MLYEVITTQIKDIVEKAGFEFALLEKYTEKAQLINAVNEANAVIIRSDIIDNEVISSSGKLEIVVRAGAGYDNVDLASASAKKIVVMNTPGQNSNAVAELAFGMMVYHAVITSYSIHYTKLYEFPQKQSLWTDRCIDP